MKNSDHLLISANFVTNMLVCFAHLMTALNAFNHIDIIFNPQSKGIFSLALWTSRPGNKSFTHRFSD